MRRLATLGLIAICAASMSHAQDWPSYGGDPGGARYQPADEITPQNVDTLIPVWTYRTGHLSRHSQAEGRVKFQTTPIYADRKLVLCTPYNEIIALDPATGAELWRHDPAIDMDQHPGNGYNCRGVSLWRDPDAPEDAQCAARIFTGTNDHRLVAVDLATGAPCKGFGENGVVAVDPGAALAWPGEFQITSPPAIIGDTVIVGSAISDNVRREAPRGTVRAFDARTGAPRWSFDPVPRGVEAVALGWPGDNPPSEGHANAWAPMAVDDARGLVFAPTSSPSPDFFGGARPGDNRYANSVVALEAASGEVRWAFQTVHHDVWDYDLPGQPTLATIRHGGSARDVVIVATKTGFVFVLDRDTGAPVFPVEERAVPQDGAPGETLSPTQPFPVLPPPLSRSAITPQDAYGITPLDRGSCRKAIAAARRDGLFTPPSLEGSIVFPFTGGGANWGSGAFDPASNRYVVNTTNAMHLISLVPRAKAGDDFQPIAHGEQAPMRGAPYAMRRQVMLGAFGLPCNPPPWGELHAIDLDTGDIAWTTTLGTTEDLAPLGLALKTGTPGMGGPIATGGGLVFIAAALDNYLRAFSIASGEELWRTKLPAGGQATPMSFVHDGRQYVVIAAGGHYEAGSKPGDFVRAFALARPGEPRPSALTRFFDSPGRRFAGNIFGIGLLLAAASIIGRRIVIARKARRHAVSGR